MRCACDVGQPADDRASRRVAGVLEFIDEKALPRIAPEGPHCVQIHAGGALATTPKPLRHRIYCRYKGGSP